MHNELTSVYLTKRTKLANPKPNELPKNNLMGEPVCVAKQWDDSQVEVKRLTSLVIAGCPTKESQFHFKLTERTQNPNVSLKYSQKRDSSFGKETTLNSESTIPPINHRWPKSSHQLRKRSSSTFTTYTNS